MTETQKKLIMYYEIHRLHNDEGLSIRKIADLLACNRRTVKRYLSMSDQQYLDFLTAQKERARILCNYTDFVKSKLEQYPDTSCAQMHDWLKEYHPDFPGVAVKTVYNFVWWVRQRFNIPLPCISHREYGVVPEQPAGKQGQLDFGEYNMHTADGKRVKVHFLVCQLCFSRAKYLYFQVFPFTTQTAITVHERSFEFFKGIPQQIIYDQDTLFLYDENKGKLLMTRLFSSYVLLRGFTPVFCRKSDPESKGKIENVVKYVKRNFLHNRVFEDIDQLNAQALGWLERTGNGIEHSTTRKIPALMLEEERPFLSPWIPVCLPKEADPGHTVLKDNTIRYRGNTYTLPKGTYKNTGSRVYLRREDEKLIVRDMDNHTLVTHYIPAGKGIKVINNNHLRDNSAKIAELKQQVAGLFVDPSAAIKYLDAICKKYPRYSRDQLLEIKKAVGCCPKSKAQETLLFCLDNNILSTTDFHHIIKKSIYPQQQIPQAELRGLSAGAAVIAATIPAKSDISLYESILSKPKTFNQNEHDKRKNQAALSKP